MKQYVVTVEVMTAEWDLVKVFQKSLQHDIAKGKIEAAAMDPRAIAELDAVNPWDLAIIVWNDVEDEDRYLAVYFPASTACQAIAKHFQIDAGLLRRATTPAEVHRLCSEQERQYAKVMQPLGLHKNSKLSVIDREFSYEKASIDASPQITATGFRARARLKRVGVDDMVEQEKYAPDLGIFSTLDEAVNCARQWAITYYDQHWS